MPHATAIAGMAPSSGQQRPGGDDQNPMNEVLGQEIGESTIKDVRRQNGGFTFMRTSR